MKQIRLSGNGFSFAEASEIGTESDWHGGDGERQTSTEGSERGRR